MPAPFTAPRQCAPRSFAAAISCLAFAALAGAQAPTMAAALHAPPPAVEPTSALLRGVLRDQGSRAGLPEGAIVLLDTLGEPGTKTARTDSVGFFELEIPAAGSYRILARRPGYSAVLSAPLAIASGEVVEVELPLAEAGLPGATEAMILAREPIVASAAVPAPFARRRASARGLFLGPDELRRSAFRTVGELVARLAHGWWAGPGAVRSAAGAAAASDAADEPGPAATHGGCHPDWYLNGEPTEIPEASLLRLSPAELRAAELYRAGADLPAELAERGRCGAVVLWAR